MRRVRIVEVLFSGGARRGCGRHRPLCYQQVWVLDRTIDLTISGGVIFAAALQRWCWIDH